MKNALNITNVQEKKQWQTSAIKKQELIKELNLDFLHQYSVDIFLNKNLLSLESTRKN